MGHSTSAYSIIGLKIKPASALYKTVLYKVGQHNQPSTVRFDPTTGQPLWKERLVLQIKTQDGILVYHPDCENSRSPFVIVGVDVSDSIIIPTAQEARIIRDNVKKLVPEHLWDDSNFRLWSMVYHSY